MSSPAFVEDLPDDGRLLVRLAPHRHGAVDLRLDEDRIPRLEPRAVHPALRERDEVRRAARQLQLATFERHADVSDGP